MLFVGYSCCQVTRITVVMSAEHSVSVLEVFNFKASFVLCTKYSALYKFYLGWFKKHLIKLFYQGKSPRLRIKVSSRERTHKCRYTMRAGRQVQCEVSLLRKQAYSAVWTDKPGLEDQKVKSTGGLESKKAGWHLNQSKRRLVCNSSKVETNNPSKTRQV